MPKQNIAPTAEQIRQRQAQQQSDHRSIFASGAFAAQERR